MIGPTLAHYRIRRIKIPDEVVERAEGGVEGGYEAEYLVEPVHIKEGLEV